MADLGTNSAAPLDLFSSPEPSAGPNHELAQPPPLPPPPSQELAVILASWETLDEQRGFYHEPDRLDPGHGLASEKLRNRKEDDVVIFDYSLNPDHLSIPDGNPLVEESGPSSKHFVKADIFFRVSKHQLIEYELFNQIINPTKEPQILRLLGPRLRVM